MGTLTYCGQRAAVGADGRSVRDLVSGVVFRTSIEWMHLAGQTLGGVSRDGSPRSLVHAPANQPTYCVFGCGFTASWGLEGCAPGCGGVKNMCFKCFVEAHTAAEVVTAQLLNDIHLSGPFGPHFCKPCHERGYPSGQHYCDPHDRSEGWDAAMYCLENLIGYNAAHGLPGVGNAQGAYTKACALLPPDHAALVKARHLIAMLRPAGSAEAEMEAKRTADNAMRALEDFYAVGCDEEEEEEEEEEDVIERTVCRATEAVPFDELGARVPTAAELDDDVLVAELARIERIGRAREGAQLQRALSGSSASAVRTTATSAVSTASTAAATAATALAQASTEDIRRFVAWVARIEVELRHLATLDSAVAATEAAAAAPATDGTNSAPQEAANGARSAEAIARRARKRDLLVERTMLEEEIAALVRTSAGSIA